MMDLNEMKDYWKSEKMKPNSYFDCDWHDIEATGKQLMDIAQYMMSHDDEDCDEKKVLTYMDLLREDTEDMEKCVKVLDHIEEYINEHGRRKSENEEAVKEKKPAKKPAAKKPAAKKSTAKKTTKK